MGIVITLMILSFIMFGTSLYIGNEYYKRNDNDGFKQSLGVSTIFGIAFVLLFIFAIQLR